MRSHWPPFRFTSIVPKVVTRSRLLPNARASKDWFQQNRGRMDLFGLGSSSKAKKPKAPGSGGGSVVISTLKRRVHQPSPSSPSPSPASCRTPAAANALPADIRARIEAAREAERRQQIEAEANAQVRTKNVAARKKQKRSTSPRRKSAAMQDFINSDRESDAGSASRRNGKNDRETPRSDDGDLFGSGDEEISWGSSAKRFAASRSTSRKGTPLQHSSSASVYTYLGRSGVQQPYQVARPARLQPEDDTSMASRAAVSSAQLVETAMAKKPRSWGPFFKDLPLNTESGEIPRCTLEYPGEAASEDFLLVVARDPDEYDPISDLLRSVYVIVKYYLKPEERESFGELDELETSSAAGHIWPGPIEIVTEANGASGSDTLVPPITTGNSAPGTPAYVTPAMIASTSPNSGSNTPPHFLSISGSQPLSTTSGSSASVLRSFTKSRNRRSGVLFLETVARFNRLIVSLRSSGILKRNVQQLVRESGVPDNVWLRIQDQAYARSVAPRVDELSGYRSFSDNVYGELTPRFMSEISQLCGLRPEHTMLDLGCGVGNLVVQSALQVGCISLGVEAMPTPAALGEQQLAEAKIRWTKMWGLAPFIPTAAKDVAVWQGDFLEDEEVRKRMKDVDLIIVNNYAFTPPLNQSLSLLFLDLKDGAKIVSLKPFVPADFRLTERTLGSSSAILRVEEREYGQGMVSWTERGGKYYIAKVDRSGLKKFLDQGGNQASSTPMKIGMQQQNTSVKDLPTSPHGVGSQGEGSLVTGENEAC